MRFPEPAAARKSHPTKNGTRHSFRPHNPNKGGSKTTISIMERIKRKTATALSQFGKALAVKIVFVGLLIAPLGNLTAHEDAANDNHIHITLADGTVVSACWYEFPLPDDYQPWERPSNILDSANWQIVGGDEVWGYMPCNELSIWQDYHDDLERAKLKEEKCKAQSAGQMADEKWQRWDSYDDCIRDVHIAVAVCIISEAATRCPNWWNKSLEAEIDNYGRDAFNALSLAQQRPLTKKWADKTLKALKNLKPLCAASLIWMQVDCWDDLWNDLRQAEELHDERVNACEAKRLRDENRARRRRDRAVQRAEEQARRERAIRNANPNDKNGDGIPDNLYREITE